MLRPPESAALRTGFAIAGAAVAAAAAAPATMASTTFFGTRIFYSLLMGAEAMCAPITTISARPHDGDDRLAAPATQETINSSRCTLQARRAPDMSAEVRSGNSSGRSFGVGV